MEMTPTGPGCPPEEARAIAAHTSARGSGRAGRKSAGRALEEQAFYCRGSSGHPLYASNPARPRGSARPPPPAPARCTAHDPCPSRPLRPRHRARTRTRIGSTPTRNAPARCVQDGAEKGGGCTFRALCLLSRQRHPASGAGAPTFSVFTPLVPHPATVQ